MKSSSMSNNKKSPDEKAVEGIDTILGVQGGDPVTDCDVGFALFRHIPGIEGVYAPPKACHGVVRSIFEPLLKDPKRDMVFAELTFKWTFIHMPFWFWLLTCADYRGSPFVFYPLLLLWAVMWIDSMETYILALHCIVHRSMYKPSAIGRFLKWWYVWAIGPMLGVTPETYQAHHINMHHVANNGYKDLSSTMMYRRDSIVDFSKYLFRFLTVHRELYQYLKETNPTVNKRWIQGELSWLAFGLSVALFRPLPALVMYFLPVVLVRIGQTCGNWGQHAFINDDDPFENLNQSAVILNSEYNRNAFNDGYHILHHIYPASHYEDLPKLFVAELKNMARNDSMVFSGHNDSTGRGPVLDWPSVWLLLMRKRYDILALHFVDCRALVNGTAPRSLKEVEALIKSRTSKKYHESQCSPLTAKKQK